MDRAFLSSAPRDQGLEIKMFNLDNTSGFTQADCDLMNQAVAVLMERGIDESNANDIVNNNWQEVGNTVESLTAR
jgi:hypothetical protein